MVSKSRAKWKIELTKNRFSFLLDGPGFLPDHNKQRRSEIFYFVTLPTFQLGIKLHLINLLKKT